MTGKISDLSKWGSKLAVGKVAYDPSLEALIVPWMDGIHTWVGFAYHFPGGGRSDFLIYVVPVQGAFTYRVHQTSVKVDPTNPNYPVLGSRPDPKTDPLVSGFEVSDLETGT